MLIDLVDRKGVTEGLKKEIVGGQVEWVILFYEMSDVGTPQPNLIIPKEVSASKFPSKKYLSGFRFDFFFIPTLTSFPHTWLLYSAPSAEPNGSKRLLLSRNQGHADQVWPWTALHRTQIRLENAPPLWSSSSVFHALLLLLMLFLSLLTPPSSSTGLHHPSASRTGPKLYFLECGPSLQCLLLSQCKSTLFTFELLKNSFKPRKYAL